METDIRIRMAFLEEHRALLAACLAAALAVGAGASGVLKSAAEVFAPIFGGSAAQTEVIDKIGHPIGAGDTDNGVTITADAIIGDTYNAAIVYTIRRDDGTPGRWTRWS